MIQSRNAWFPPALIFLCAGYLLQAGLNWQFPNTNWKPDQLMHSNYYHILKFLIIPLQMFRFGLASHGMVRSRFQMSTSLFLKYRKSVLFIAIGENLLFIFLFTAIWYILASFIDMGYFSIWNSLAFCSAMIASDSSVSISFFRAKDCPPQLMTIMEGDTILSEIIAILLFRTIVDIQFNAVNTLTVMEGVLYFFRFLVSTLLIGATIGLSSSLLMKALHKKSTKLQYGEAALFIAVPIASYLWAEGLHMSSSVAIRICGIFMARYTQYNLNAKTYPCPPPRNP